MECKSIRSSSSSSTTWKHDVFVSFRGEDTRNNFTDHLFAALRRKGIVAFKDDTNLKQGGHISTELMQAIEESQVLIVVFSKNYATSSWCLQELEKIVDCMEVPRGQIVLPIFYDVNPSEVRKQSGDYRKAFAELEKRFKQDLEIVQRWREALVQVANLAGWNVQNKPQHTEIEKIVKRVINILGYKLSSLDGLVGMHPRVEKLEKLLNLDSNNDVRVVGIYGMGGIGKTTLARVVYDINADQYSATCFIDDVSKVYHDFGPIGLQKQLICQILNEEIQDIWNHSRATYLIKNRLRRVKAFIILNNVDRFDQLENLGVNRECLSPGSRIIIISRDRQILNNYGVDEVYDAQLLNEDEACQLFCRTAFKRDYIMNSVDIVKEFEVLTNLALEYAQCLPLAIKVLGSHLQCKNISEWRSALAHMKDNPKTEVMDVLQISFDGLEPMEKEIFLDIACFFPNRTSKEYVMRILDCCGYYSEIAMSTLVEKSFITIRDSAIEMHDLMRELGRKIVRQKAPNEPRKWSRIWRYQDLHTTLYEKKAMDNLEAICLESETRTKENITLRTEALSRMNHLRLLILSDANISGSLNCLSDNLQYLSLPRSNIEQLWEGIKPLHMLKIIDLHGSEDLVKTPDFSEAQNLRELDLEGCTKLVHIHPSIGLLRHLRCLNLKNCTSLTSLPKSTFRINSLEVVNLAGCSKLFRGRL